MAKKAAKKAAAPIQATPQQPAPQQLPLSILVDPTEDNIPFYSNHAEVAISQHEFVLSFCRIPTKLGVARSEEAKSGTLRVEPIVQVIVPPSLVPGLIQALQTMMGTYQAAMAALAAAGAKK